jgi:hypothetical protein
MGVSLASDVAVVMVLVRGHLGGEEQDSRRPWWWRPFGYDISLIMLRRPSSETASDPIAGVCIGFFGRKPRILTLTAAMPAGVVTLLGVPLWVPFA